MKKMITLIAALLVAATVSASALTTEQVSVIEDSISNAKLAKVGATASELVTKATEADRQDVVVQVIRATKSHKAGALVQTVVAISKANPEMASVAASTAANLSKKQALKIATAAMKAAPAYADAISTEVASVAPEYAAQITAAAAKVPVYVGKDAAGNTTGYATIYSPRTTETHADPNRKPYTKP